MLVFYTYFSPAHAMLYAVQVLPVLLLLSAWYFSILTDAFLLKYVALTAWTWLLVERNLTALLAFWTAP